MGNYSKEDENIKAWQNHKPFYVLQFSKSEMYNADHPSIIYPVKKMLEPTVQNRLQGMIVYAGYW